MSSSEGIDSSSEGSDSSSEGPGDTPTSISSDSENCLNTYSVPHLDIASRISSPLSEPACSQTPASPTSPGMSTAFFSLGLSPITSREVEYPRLTKRIGRPRKRFYGNMYTAKPSTDAQDPIVFSPKQFKAKNRKFAKVFPSRGYVAKFRIPAKSYSKPVLLCSPQGEIARDAHRPIGMRLLDVGILAEVFSSFRCTECIWYSCFLWRKMVSWMADLLSSKM